MSIDQDLSAHFKTSAAAFRPAPGDLDTVVRNGRRRVRRRRIGAGGVVVLALLVAVVAPPAVRSGIVGPGVVATDRSITDGGVPVTVIDVPVDGTVAVGGVDGFMLLDDTHDRALGFWGRMADRLGWLPDLAVYSSSDGTHWDRSTHSDAVFADVSYVIDAIAVNDTVSLLAGVVSSDQPTAPPAYRLLQTTDFETWDSADVPVVGPAILPEGLEWWIQRAWLVAAGDRPAVVTSVFPNLTTEFRSGSWSYDSVDGWTASTRDGRALRIPLEEVTPAGTDPTRTVVMTADIDEGSDASGGRFEALPSIPGADRGEALVEVGFTEGRWIAITSGRSGDHTVWKGNGESDWELEDSVPTPASAITADGVVALVADGASWQLTRLDGNRGRLGEPFGDVTNAVPSLIASDTAIVALSGRSAWVYSNGEWTERNLDFSGWTALPAYIADMTEGDRAAEAARVQALLVGVDNQLSPLGPMFGRGLLGARKYSPDSWWVFDLG